MMLVDAGFYFMPVLNEVLGMGVVTYALNESYGGETLRIFMFSQRIKLGIVVDDKVGCNLKEIDLCPPP